MGFGVVAVLATCSRGASTYMERKSNTATVIRTARNSIENRCGQVNTVSSGSLSTMGLLPSTSSIKPYVFFGSLGNISKDFFSIFISLSSNYPDYTYSLYLHLLIIAA